MLCAGARAATGGLTTTVVVAPADSAPLSAVSVNESVSAGLDEVNTGAVNVAFGDVTPARVTAGAPVWVQAYVSARDGLFKSVAPPPIATVAPESTICGGPTVTTGAPIVELTVTVVIEDVDNAPLSTVSVKPSTTGALPTAGDGAMNAGLAAFALVKETAGPEVCVHAKVSGRAGVFRSTPTPVRVTAAPEATVFAAPASAVGGLGAGFTVTVVIADALADPLSAVSEKLNVTGAASAPSAGAVNDGVSVEAPVSATEGPPVCSHANVSGRAGLLVSSAVPAR